MTINYIINEKMAHKTIGACKDLQFVRCPTTYQDMDSTDEFSVR